MATVAVGRQKPKSLNTCFMEGVTARDAGKPHSDNPYCPASPEREEWKAGWSACPDLDEDDDPASDRAKSDDD